METMNKRALAIIDAQNDFINGSLAVIGAEKIIRPINELTRIYRRMGMAVATTQDWHPEITAHFAEEPNFVDTWPAHCVAGTPGAELYPDLDVTKDPALADRFIKGTEPCMTPADDDSYTGVLARNEETGLSLPEWLERNDIEEVDVVGLALGDGDKHPLCVDSTAIGLQELGYKVNVVTDAVEAVLPENRELCFRNLGNRGIRLVTLDGTLRALRTQEA